MRSQPRFAAPLFSRFGRPPQSALACVVGSSLALAAWPSMAAAWEFRCRFVERIGTQDVVVLNNAIDASDFAPHNVRLQFGVFDDAAGPAPAGGFIGWNIGTLAVSGAPSDSDERRNPGRLAPFNFLIGGNSNGDPPLPAGDPFTRLTDIDATLGTQAQPWSCVPDGAGGMMPGPIPQPTIRGFNTFVSVYAFSVHPIQLGAGYTVTAAGNLIAATDWRIVGTPNPPECPDPSSVTYAPVVAPNQSFSCTLTVTVPAPLAAPPGVLVGMCLTRRRRRTP